jgi:hypothetical protein
MRRVLAVILLLALPLLGLGLATPASAQTTPAIDVTSATLVAKGAAIDVDLTVTCEAGTQGFVGVNATQRSGNIVMSGSGSTLFVCTGEPQPVTVRVLAQSGGAPFRVGEAVVEAFLIGITGISETVRVRR